MLHIVQDLMHNSHQDTIVAVSSIAYFPTTIIDQAASDASHQSQRPSQQQ